MISSWRFYFIAIILYTQSFLSILERSQQFFVENFICHQVDELSKFSICSFYTLCGIVLVKASISGLTDIIILYLPQ